MNGWFPEKLFRYRGTTSKHFDEELEQLRDNRVWLNFLDTQNDPFEGCVSHRVGTYDEFTSKHRELRDLLAKEFPGFELLPETISEQDFNICNIQSPLFHETVRQQAVVASFSKGWQSTLMWGHYADAFKGICLQFTASPTAGVEGPPFFPVQYWKEEPPEFSSFDFFVQTRVAVSLSGLTESEQRTTIANLAYEKIKVAATSKSYDWVYEEEVRMASFLGVPGYYQVPGMKLTGVIFGPRVEAPTYSRVMNALGEGIDYFRMDLRANAYGYVLFPITTPAKQAFL
ncbi:DUF2971 domain-containing protein [Ruegeria arenilitoris]|uniref:DUF2971 domain-containing protein n=1 Tax=Ruegeria arenilitoris TaxID=1173585 RepID=UPI00147C8873|nr:DUF2971 domain-containing protein [Ruegeria arenilitoris]